MARLSPFFFHKKAPFFNEADLCTKHCYLKEPKTNVPGAVGRKVEYVANKLRHPVV
jgi:hypothetical protein